MRSPCSRSWFPVAQPEMGEAGEQLRTVTMHWYTLPFCDTSRTGTDSEKLVLGMLERSVLLRYHSAPYRERARPGCVLQFSWAVSPVNKNSCICDERSDSGYAAWEEIIDSSDSCVWVYMILHTVDQLEYRTPISQFGHVNILCHFW